MGVTFRLVNICITLAFARRGATRRVAIQSAAGVPAHGPATMAFPI